MEGGSDDEEEAKQAKAVNVDEIQMEEMKAPTNEPDIPEEHFEGAVELWAAKRTVVIVEPEKVITWDHSKLGGAGPYGY